MFSTMRLGRFWPRKACIAAAVPESGIAVGDEVIDRVQGGSRWIVERYVGARHAAAQHVVLRYADGDGRLRLVSERQLRESGVFSKADPVEKPRRN